MICRVSSVLLHARYLNILCDWDQSGSSCKFMMADPATPEPDNAGTSPAGARGWRNEPPWVHVHFDFATEDLMVTAGVAGERLPIQIPLRELDELICGAWVGDADETSLRVLFRLRNEHTMRVAATGAHVSPNTLRHPVLELQTVRAGTRLRDPL